MSDLSIQIIDHIETSEAIKQYRRQRSNRKSHVFSGNVHNFKASIYLGIQKQRARNWSPTKLQDEKIDAVVTEHLLKLYTILASQSASKIFSYEMMKGSSASNFKAIVSGDGDVEGHIQRIRDDAGIRKVSNVVKTVFGLENRGKIEVDVGHMEGSTIADQFATEMLMRFESTGNIPVDTRAYEKLKVMIKYDPLAAKLARVYVENQFGLINQGSTKEAEVSNLLQQALGDFVQKEAPNLIRPRINKETNNFLDIAKKAGAKTTKKLPVAKKQTSSKTKNIKSTNKISKVTAATFSVGGLVKATSASEQKNWSSLKNILNNKLPQQVAKNMGEPGLVYRTGRFANSAQVVSIQTTKSGSPSIVFDYQRDPYDVFDRTLGKSPWNTPARDPRALVDKSVREIAQEMAIGRFYTRRA